MNPDVPKTKVLDNPYTYTTYQSDSTHGGRPSFMDLQGVAVSVT